MKKKVIKKIKLKERVKTVLILLAAELVVLGMFWIYSERIEAIENGTLTQINENQRDR